MSQRVDVTPHGPHTYTVTVAEGRVRTSHLVTVAEGIRDLLAVDDAGEAELVRESFGFLLEREPATGILGRFDLTDVSRYFPDYLEQIRLRLGH